jgi:O-antigen/teichoic acid export membrane protein
MDKSDSPLFEPHDPEEFDNSLSPAALRIEELAAPLPRRRRVLGVVGNFVFGQGATQIINVLVGLFLVRKLSLEAYAQFGVATGFQNVFSVLMDLGFASTIVPLVGARANEYEVTGRYVRAARHLRDRSFLLLAPVACVAFLYVVHKHHWSWALQLALLASVLVSLYSSGVASFFSAPLLLHRRIREYYLPQLLTSVARLALYGALLLLHVLNAWTAAGLAALTFTANAIFIRRSAQAYMRWPEKDDKEAERELMRYVLPATPAIVFSAFQSQISLFLVSLFGSTIHIAEVAALGRIGQLFLVLMTFNTVVIEPFVAKLDRSRIARYFVIFPLLGALACSPLVLVAFRWPQVFVLLLGQKFVGLAPYMGWYVLSASMNFVSGLIWIMNRSRKWVFWSGSIVEVVLLLAVQAIFLAYVGVSTTQQAVFFLLASSCCYAIAHGYVTVVGFRHKSLAD